MIVKDLEQVRAEGNEVVSDGWTSRRYLLKKDGMGFSFHETIIEKGAELHMWYKNHLEAVYCISGEGTLYSKDEDKTWEIKPGVMYALNKNDKHILTGTTEIRLLCTFNPPVTGQEKHDEDGAYALVEED